MAKEYERQIMVLKKDLKQAKTKQTMTNNAPTPITTKPIPARRTRYALIVAINSSDEEAKNLLNENDGWKTVVRKVSQVVKSNVDIKETGPLRNKINLKSGKIILESNTMSQNDAVKTALTGVPEIKVRELTNQDPTIILTGVEKGYDDTQILTKPYTQNTRVQELFTSKQSWKENIKYLTRTCRNPEKKNWTFQVTSKLFSFLEKEGRVILDLVEVMVEERVHVPLCYRCCAFGHVAKYCRSPTSTCTECGETGHERKNCMATIKNCANCRRFLEKILNIPYLMLMNRAEHSE